MNVLIIGSGGREHALGWKIAQSPTCGKLYFAPGNAGTLTLGYNVDIPMTEIKALVDFAKTHVDFTIVGPELPLSLGVVDAFREAGLPIFGPDKAAARLESSKAYAKGFMKQYNIPTAAYDIFSKASDALEALPGRAYPLWVKADGLAAGKGAIFCRDENEARDTIQALMAEKSLGSAGETVVLEEHMEGKEVSLLCLTDGKTILPMDSARDYQRVNDHDTGPNTGGMGCISPVPDFVPGSADAIMQATLSGIQAEGLDYRGIIYIGLMLTPQGPKVVEYNARFGDPEPQALLPRLDSDLLEILVATAEQRLHEVTLHWKPQPAVCVVMASGGYPGSYVTGCVIEGLPEDKNGTVFHAGTALKDGVTVTSGGRVLAVTALGDNWAQAREAAYKMTEKISFEAMHYRKDIG